MTHSPADRLRDAWAWLQDQWRRVGPLFTISTLGAAGLGVVVAAIRSEGPVGYFWTVLATVIAAWQLWGAVFALGLAFVTFQAISIATESLLTRPGRPLTIGYPPPARVAGYALGVVVALGTLAVVWFIAYELVWRVPEIGWRVRQALPLDRGLSG